MEAEKDGGATFEKYEREYVKLKNILENAERSFTPRGLGTYCFEEDDKFAYRKALIGEDLIVPPSPLNNSLLKLFQFKFLFLIDLKIFSTPMKLRSVHDAALEVKLADHAKSMTAIVSWLYLTLYKKCVIQ